MYELLLTVILILSIFTIIVIALQPSKTQSASDAFMGGGGQQQVKQKARGLEAVLVRTTIVCLILFFILSFVLTNFF